MREKSFRARDVTKVTASSRMGNSSVVEMNAVMKLWVLWVFVVFYGCLSENDAKVILLKDMH